MGSSVGAFWVSTSGASVSAGDELGAAVLEEVSVLAVGALVVGALVVGAFVEASVLQVVYAVEFTYTHISFVKTLS